jgi:hypothetical protein
MCVCACVRVLCVSYRIIARTSIGVSVVRTYTKKDAARATDGPRRTAHYQRRRAACTSVRVSCPWRYVSDVHQGTTPPSLPFCLLEMDHSARRAHGVLPRIGLRRECCTRLSSCRFFEVAIDASFRLARTDLFWGCCVSVIGMCPMMAPLACPGFARCTLHPSRVELW